MAKKQKKKTYSDIVAPDIDSVTDVEEDITIMEDDESYGTEIVMGNNKTHIQPTVYEKPESGSYSVVPVQGGSFSDQDNLISLNAFSQAYISDDVLYIYLVGKSSPTEVHYEKALLIGVDGQLYKVVKN